MTVVGHIEQWNKGSSVPTNSHVGWTKVSHSRNPEPTSEDCAFTSLPCSRNRSTEETGRNALVIDGLAMTAHKINVGILIPHSLGNCLGIQLTKKKTQACKIGNTSGTSIHGSQHGLPHRVRIAEMFVSE